MKTTDPEPEGPETLTPVVERHSWYTAAIYDEVLDRVPPTPHGPPTVPFSKRGKKR